MKRLQLLMLEAEPTAVAACLALGKAAVLGYLLGLAFSPWRAVAATVAVFFLIGSWTIALPHWLRPAALTLLSVAVSGLLLGDVLFFRYYGSLVPLVVLYQSGQLGAIWRSVAALLTWRDPLLFSDLALLLPYLIWYQRRQDRRHVQARQRARAETESVALGLTRQQARQLLRQRVPRLPDYAGPVLAVSLTILSLGLALLADGRWVADTEARRQLYASGAALQDTGPLGFHLADLTRQTLAGSGTVDGLSDDSLRTWEELHQKQPQDLFGAARGRNVIVVQMESLQGFLVERSIDGQEITPNLNRLAQSGIYFDNYFTQVAQGNTADAEFMTFNSLYPAPAGAAYFQYGQNTYRSLPQALKEDGSYRGAYVFHAFQPDYWNRDKMYPRLGIDRFYSLGDYTFDEAFGMGLTDESFYRQTLPKLEGLPQPFYAMVISLSAHHPFVVPADKQELHIPATYGEPFANYLQAQHYADKALGEFIAGLKRDGLLDKSLLVVYGDHFGFGWSMQDLQRFLGQSQPLDAYESAELDRVPLVVRLPGGQNAGVRHISGGQVDLFPTLANLLGLPRERLFYFGQDLLNTSDGFTAFRRYLPEGSFATNDVFYIAAGDGVFEDGHAYNRVSGQPRDLTGLKTLFSRAKWELQASDHILAADALPRLLPHSP